ncbi:MAG: SPOR domain-containing protein, partial [Pseudoxanthomonas sp.]
AAPQPPAATTAPKPAPAATAPVETASAAGTQAATTPAPALVCLRLGPFADAAAGRAALATLGRQALRSRVQEQTGRGAAAYTVSLPPQADRDAALALAQRIKDAGFDDLLVVPTGEQSNSIALGRYRNLEGAERRQQSLQAKGFAARINPVGEPAPPQWWLDVALRDGETPRAVAGRIGAMQVRELECAAVR